MAAYTLAEATQLLALWKDCERQLATGQAKEYKIGSREFRAIDLPYIISRINFFANLVGQLSGTAKTSRVHRVVPRDI